MRRFGAVLVGVVLFGGCASLAPADRAYWTGAVADYGTTVMGLENGCQEAGLVHSSNDTAAVLATSFALDYLVWRLVRDRTPAFRWAFGAVRLGGAAGNTQKDCF